jgi:ERCC4-type nuclease
MTVVVDTRERYPWKLACKCERRALRCGDYALVDGEQVLAVVERKTFENFLHELGTLRDFHQSLLDLAGVEHHALVIEAAYGDLLSPKKLHHYKPDFVAKALAEMHAVHPRLRIVFTENRKLAMEWTLRYFAALWERHMEAAGQLVLL